MRLNPHELRRVAVAAVCDPRTVRAVITGRPVLTSTRVRVETALRDLGLPEAQAPGPHETLRGRV
jgi:hypothetical protein